MGVVSARQVLWQGYGWHRSKCNESALDLVWRLITMSVETSTGLSTTVADIRIRYHHPLMTASVVRRRPLLAGP